MQRSDRAARRGFARFRGRAAPGCPGSGHSVQATVTDVRNRGFERILVDREDGRVHEGAFPRGNSAIISSATARPARDTITAMVTKPESKVDRPNMRFGLSSKRLNFPLTGVMHESFL